MCEGALRMVAGGGHPLLRCPPSPARAPLLPMESVDAALSCGDILLEILIRLPAKSIFKVVIVSKQWLHLICSSYFRHHYLSRERVSFRPMGFFMSTSMYLRRDRPLWEPTLPFLSTCQESNNLKSCGFLNRLGYFIHSSSNGLLLCGFHTKTYYVCNPITQHLFRLPQPRVSYQDFCMTLVSEECFNDDDDVFYKVIRADCEVDEEVNNLSIETFSSKTRMWEPSTLTCSSPFSLRGPSDATHPSASTVIRGVIYWWARYQNLAVYDPSLGGKRVSLIQLPPSNEVSSEDCNAYVLGESSDGHLQFGRSSSKLGIEIWVFDEEGWNLRYDLSFDIMLKEKSRFKESAILSFLPHNSEFVFIRSGQRILKYHLESGKLKVVKYQGCGFSIRWDDYRVLPYIIPAWPKLSLKSQS